MSVLYLHFRQGREIRQAIAQLGIRYLHLKIGRPGILDYVFARYLAHAEPRGIAFSDWVDGPDYDPAELKDAYARRARLGSFPDRLLCRE